MDNREKVLCGLENPYCLREPRCQGCPWERKNESYVEFPITLIYEFLKMLKAEDAPDTDDGQWVSVKERLPEEKINPITLDFCEVLCYVDFGGKFGSDVCVYKFGRGHFWHGPENMDDLVTHWAPMPKPPKNQN